MIYPLPALLVSCGATPDEYNIFTAAWAGTICSDPAMCYVSIRPERHSHDIVERNMAFTLNLTNRDLARATDWCGVRSGRDCDKTAISTPTPARSTWKPHSSSPTATATTTPWGRSWDTSDGRCASETRIIIN